MSTPGPVGGSRRFKITVSPSFRTLAVASSIALFGVLVLMFWGVRDRGALLLSVGTVAVVGAVVVGLGAFVVAARQSTVALLDDDGITLVRKGGSRRLRWVELDELSRTPTRLTLHPRGAGRVASVYSPPGSARTLALLADAAQERLDAVPDRGTTWG